MAAVTREQFEYSIVATFGEYAGSIADKLMLTEINEQELRKFKTLNSCVKCIQNYFRRYNGDVAPIDDVNGLTKSEIQDIVQLYNLLLGTNYWYSFPDDV